MFTGNEFKISIDLENSFRLLYKQILFIRKFRMRDGFITSVKYFRGSFKIIIHSPINFEAK